MSSKYHILPNNYESSAFDSILAKCLLCDSTFYLSYKLYVPRVELDKLRSHLLTEHQLVISDINEIIDLTGYLNYWRQKFLENTDLRQFCAVIRTNCKPEDTEESQNYFLLCPEVLPEDSYLRKDLQLARLNKLLSIVEKEKSQNDFVRPCLFCRKELKGKRKAYFEHLKENHNFSFGNPDNLIFTDEFLNLIDKKLDNRICLFCEHYFKDWNALKEHMRKKHHKHLNPFNRSYDKFYISNYIKGEQNWNSFFKDNDNKNEKSNQHNGNETWEDWIQDEEEKLQLNCFFCDTILNNLTNFTSHLTKEHQIDFNEIMQTSFYLQVKLVNYVRKCQLTNTCLNCNKQFEHETELTQHYQQSAHLHWPCETNFDKPEYLLPSKPEDDLLRVLVDFEPCDEHLPVIPEDDKNYILNMSNLSIS